AEEGGGIANEFGTLAVDGSLFLQNTSTFPGGAVASFGNAVTVTNSLFYGNQSGIQGGGALWFTGTATATVDTCTFSSNEARETSGGAIRSAAPLVVKRSQFFDNHAEDRGGAIEGVNMDIRTSSFGRNGAQLGGAIATRGAVTLTRTTVTGNAADVDGGGFYAADGGVAPAMSLTIIAGNTPNDIKVVP